MTAPAPDERSWSEFGFHTPMEVEGFREWERTARDVCACSHLRQGHFADRCVHVVSTRSSSGVWRIIPCPCEGWTAPVTTQACAVLALSATESVQNATGRGLGAERGTA